MTVSARAALAGNPSDGYGGAVVAVPVPAFGATARFAARDVDELPLVLATRRRFALEVDPVATPPIDVATTIPRSVGLAGSSAIVIAVLRLLADHVGTELAPDELARHAHTVERVDLGIAGGWQDQVVQSRGSPLLMEFGDGVTTRELEPAPVTLYLAWSQEDSVDSGLPHADLRARAGVHEATMDELARTARRCAEALESGEIADLEATMDRTLELRAELMTLDPGHLRMVETARAHGAAANYTGSGGAIVGVIPARGEDFLDGMHAAGYATHTWQLR